MEAAELHSRRRFDVRGDLLEAVPCRLGTALPGPFRDQFFLVGIGLCAALGIVSGLQSGLLTTLLYKIEDMFEKLPIHWMWWPAIGGAVVGLGGLIEPSALGVGYDIIGKLLHDQYLPSAVLTILLVKAAIWLVALSSGTSGGVLAPLLILGGALGWLVGLVLPGDPGFWALLGMAAMMGGTMRAPLTGTFFAIELTGESSALVPLLAATVSAYAITVLLLRRSILTEKIARRGQHITREYGIDPFEFSRARDIMITAVDTLPSHMSVAEALDVLANDARSHRAYPVVDSSGALKGMVTRNDVLHWQNEPTLAQQTLDDLVSDGSLPVGHPDDTVGYIADLMLTTELGRIPITYPETGVLCGLIARKDLLRLRHAARTEELERSPQLRRLIKEI